MTTIYFPEEAELFNCWLWVLHRFGKPKLEFDLFRSRQWAYTFDYVEADDRSCSAENPS